MRAKKNTPTEHLESPNIIANGAINLVNGYITTSTNLAQVSSAGASNSGSGNTYTVQICVNGSPKNLDVYVAGQPY